MMVKQILALQLMIKKLRNLLPPQKRLLGYFYSINLYLSDKKQIPR